MDVIRVLLIGMLIAALPVVAAADVIPISDVNENSASGAPVLMGQVVTVRGVVTVETGILSDNNDIYIQDATGGVNVLQRNFASPVVALGDSVEVTGVVGHATTSGRTSLFVRTSYPGTRIRVLNSGNPLPEPLALSPQDVIADGNGYEGIYAVVSGVVFEEYGYEWGACGSPPGDFRGKLVAGGDTCWIWFDAYSDFCGADEPRERFEVYGVIVPDISSSPESGHGILPPSMSSVLPVGPGSGYCSVSPNWVYTAETVDLTFSLEAEGGVLTQIALDVAEGWGFSGSSSDVVLEGDAFAGVTPITTTEYVVLDGCSLSRENLGTVTLTGVEAPDHAGTWTFTVRTADEGNDPVELVASPEVGVGYQAQEGAILINEVYAHSGGNDAIDRAEFIELHNPGTDTVDLTGWILTDIDNTGKCGGRNLWAFPDGAEIEPGGYIVVAKDAKFSTYNGFESVFGQWPDYELFDIYGTDIDWPVQQENHPNMLLVSGDTGRNHEIRLMGGADETGFLVSGMPAYEAVYLYSDKSLEYLVDAVEYRNPVLLAEDPCTGTAGIGGAHDSWVPGPVPRGVSLNRDNVSTDTDVCSADFFLAEPTPGDVNPASDTFAPSVSTASGAGLDFVIVKFSEPVDESDAVNLSNYNLGRDGLILDATLSRDGRTVLLRTERRAPGDSHELTVAGVRDVAGNEMPGYSKTVSVSSTATSIEDVQAYDDNGLCVMTGEDVSVVGFATIPPGIFQPDRTNMYIQDLEGWGVNVYSGGPMPQPAMEGDLLSVSGEVLDYVSSSTGAGATTEVDASSMTVLARGFEPIEPRVMKTGDIGHEDNEGALIATSGVVVSVEGFAIYINDGSGSIQVYQNFTDHDFSVFAVGDSVAITGLLLQYDQMPPYFEGYELAPRYDSDMVILESHYSESADIDVTARVLDAGGGESIEIAFNAPRASHVTVRIYDLKGREIATIFDGQCLGPQRATWDARNDNGERVPLGAYLCHVMAREQGRGDGSNAAVPIVIGTRLD
jgi:hypothetical protein